MAAAKKPKVKTRPVKPKAKKTPVAQGKKKADPLALAVAALMKKGLPEKMARGIAARQMKSKSAPKKVK